MAVLCHTEYAAQKKTLLENSLLQLMARQQYREITVTDICREAGVPRRTFYHYFEGKEDALESVIETLMQECLVDAVFDFQQSPEQLRNSFLKIFRYWGGENRGKLSVLMQSGLESQLMAWASRWIREERIALYLESDKDPKFLEVVLMIGTTGFFVLLFHWCQGGFRETPEEMANYAVSTMPQALVRM